MRQGRKYRGNAGTPARGGRPIALLLAASSMVAITPLHAADATGAAAASQATDETASTSASAAASPPQGQDIIVTAQRRTERLQDVPTAVSVLGRDTFTIGGIGRSANDVLTLVPNASAGTQQHGRPRWWIRGVGAGQQQLDLSSPVGFYLDDVYISNANATGLPLFDLDRVEVLRGPQGTLWGKNTTGGAINIISKKPSFTPHENDNYVKLGYGSYDDKIAEGGLGAVLVPDLIAGRVSFHVEDMNGRFHNLFTDKKDNGIQDDVFRAQLLITPSDTIEALLGFHYRRYNTSGTYWTTASYASSGVVRNGYAPSTDINDVSTNAPEWSHNKQFGGSFHLDWHLPGDLTLTAITGYEKFKTRGPGDSDYTPLEISRSYLNARSSQWTQEVRLASPQSNRFNWIAGLFYFNEKIRSDSYSATLPSGSVPALTGSTAQPAYSLTHYHHSAESGAVFGSATYDFTDALKLTFGARWTRETKKLQFDRLSSLSAATASWSNYASWWNAYTGSYGGPGTFADNLSKTWDAFTYDVTPSWNIDRHNLVYFKFSHGVKSGGFNTAATLPTALLSVAPEKLDSYEFGYKSQWLNGKLTFNATVFHYNYDDVQINVVGPNPGAVGGATISYLQNAQKAHANGAELELEARPVPHLELNGSVGLLYARYDKLQVINGGADLSGSHLVRAPHVTVNAGATYTVPLPNSGHVELEADMRYQSLQYYFITPQDTVNRKYLNQPGYTVANARISYTSPHDRYTLSFFIRNFLDTKYLNHALPIGSTPGVTGDVVYWDDPRTFGGSLVVRW